MVRYTAVALMLLFVILLPNDPVHVHGAQEVDTAIVQYMTLQKMYADWHRGLFGSRKYHEYFLREFLRNLRNRTFETDNNYIITDPFTRDEPRVRCIFLECSWLYIYGNIDEGDMKKLIEENPAITSEIIRKNFFIAVRGVVVKSRLTRDAYGDTVELYMDKIRLIYKK